MTRAIRKNVGEPAEVIEVDQSLEFWQSVVGGYVQSVPLGPEVSVLCNEEGMFSGPDGGPLPQNAAGYLGNILIVAVDSEEGDPRSLTETEVRKGLRYLEVFDKVRHPMHSGESAWNIVVGDEAKQLIEAKSRGTLGLWYAL